MQSKMLRMPLDLSAVENPPDCNTGLHPLLSANLEASKANYNLRQGLECQNEAAGFKVKVTNDGLDNLRSSFSQVDVNEDGAISVAKCAVDLLKLSTKDRSPLMVKKLVPLMKNVPFFKDRGLKDQAIYDCLSLMTLKET